MSTAANALQTSRSWFGRAEAWLDERGRGAWIAAMVLGFVLFWPVGLVILFYALWTRRLGGGCGRARRRHEGPGLSEVHAALRPSGNSAFDAYKSATLRRLEEEQEAFEAFLERLRAAKDRAEFDQFMAERASAATRPAAEEGPEADTEPTDPEAAPSAPRN